MYPYARVHSLTDLHKISAKSYFKYKCISKLSSKVGDMGILFWGKIFIFNEKLRKQIVLLIGACFELKLKS